MSFGALSPRARLITYLAGVHVLAGAVGAALYLRQPGWLFAIEAVLVGSFALGVGMIARVFRAFSFAAESALFLNDADFTSRFLPTGQPDVDRLIGVYNRMVDSLRAERQRAEEQHVLLSHVLDVSPSGMVILDYDGRIASLNPAAARLAQRAPQTLVGLVPGATGVPVIDELASIAPGEARIVPLVSGRRVRARHGRFLERGFPRSFFLLEEMTEELRRSEKAAYEKLIRMMSHEVNNSVAASGSLLESSLAYGGALDDPDRAEFERAVHIAIGRLTQLNAFMRGFADVVRLPPPARQPVNLVELLEAVETLTRARRAEHRIAWTREYPGGPVPVSADRAQLEQVLVNVIVNAMDAIEHDGAITVRVSAGERVRLVIEDTGPGISAAARHQIFTPFFTTKDNGQGIGLTVVQEVLSNHGFDYSLDGPPGGPTRFTIVF